MDLSPPPLGERSRLRVLLEHLSVIEDEREAHRVAYPLAELLLLAVCGTIADCDDYDAIADWGADHLEFLRRFLPLSPLQGLRGWGARPALFEEVCVSYVAAAKNALA